MHSLIGLKRFRDITIIATFPLMLYGALTASAQEVTTPTGRGWIETLNENDRSLNVLHTSGSHFDMGYQQGYLLRDQVVQNVQAGLVYLQNPRYVKVPASQIADAVNHLIAQTPQKYIDEVNGMIAGVAAAGGPQLSFQDVMTIQMTADLTQVVACTQFAAKGAATSNGHVIHGRNLDWETVPGFAHERAMLMVAQGSGEQATCSASWAGFVGTITGINGKGISVGTNTCFSTDSTFDGVPLSFLLRDSLESSTTLDEYTNFLNTHPRTVGTNLVVSSGQEAGGGRVAAVEVTPTRNEIYYDNDPRESHYWDTATQTSHATQDDPDWLRFSSGIPDAIVRSNHFINWDGPLPLQALQAGASILYALDPNKIIAMGYDPNDLKDANWVMANIYPNVIVPLTLALPPYDSLLPAVKEPNWTQHRYEVMQNLVTDNFGKIDPNLGMAFLCDNNGISYALTMHSLVFDSTSLELWISNARTENGVVVDATSEPFLHFNFGAAIPEPTSLAIAGAGALLAAARRKRRHERR